MPYSLRIPGLSLSPTVTETESHLTARTRLASRVLSLCAYDRALVADREARVVHLVARRWWILRSVSAIRFHDIEYVWYGYGSFPLDFSYWTRQPMDPNAQMVATVINEIDWFNVAVKVRGSPVPVLLFRCLGEGGPLTEALAMAVPFRLGAILIRILILEGDEETVSRSLAASLARIVGVPLSSPLEREVSASVDSDLLPCPSCGRELMRHASRCVYCGAQFPKGGLDTVSD